MHPNMYRLFTNIKDHSNYSLRSSSNSKLFVPRTHYKSFSYTGVIIWNALPENIEKSETFAKFQQLYIKKTLEENKYRWFQVISHDLYIFIV